MTWFGNKIWMIGCIAMAIVLSILTANYIVINKQNNALTEEAIDNMNAEWNQLYRLSETINKYYITNDFKDSENFRWYVNQTCQDFKLGRPHEINLNIHNLLVLAYDPLFKDLALEKDSLNKEKATQLFKEMNDKIMTISKSVIDMNDIEKEKLLREPTSSDVIEVSTKIKNDTDKYKKLVHDYFRENKK